MSISCSASTGSSRKRASSWPQRAWLDLEQKADHENAITYYRMAARRTTSLPERNYLNIQAARLGAPEPAIKEKKRARKKR
jgi:hypothetical protein